MTYYRVEFMESPGPAVRVKRFRTRESARKHAQRVLGLLDESGLESKVAIVAVSRTSNEPRERGTA